MPTTTECHGTRAPVSARVRRRWRRKQRDVEAAAAKKQANAPSNTHDLAGRDMPATVAVDHKSSLEVRSGGHQKADHEAKALVEKRHTHGAVGGHEHISVNSFPKRDRPSSPPSPPDSTELQSQKSHAQGHVLGHSQGRVPGHGIGRRDTILNSNWPSMPPSPPNRTKPSLSASSTSAEIVEALLPDHPVAGSFLRRAASVCSSYERKRPTIGSMILRVRRRHTMNFCHTVISSCHS